MTDRPQNGVPLAAMPAFLVVGVLTTAGIVGVVRTSLRQGILGEAGIGVRAWRRVLADPEFLATLGFTIWVAVASTIISIVGAVAVASIVRHGSRARIAITLPIASPHLVVATLAVIWLAPGGLVDRVGAGLPISIVGHRHGWGVIGVYAAKEIPFLTLLAIAVLDDATKELEDTAAMLGANAWRRLLDVGLPRMATPMIGGGLVVAAFVIGAVEVPLLLGPNRPTMLGPYALDTVRIHGPAARSDAAVAELVAAAVVFAMGLAGGLMWWRWRLMGPK